MEYSIKPKSLGERKNNPLPSKEDNWIIRDDMRIQKSSIVLDDDFKNVLVKDFAKNYAGVDNLRSPSNIVQVMTDVFDLENQAEEYLYLICMTCKCKPISFFEVSHGTHNASLAGGREILWC